MLRRTRADQVEPIYRRFLKKYPDLDTLAEAPPRDIRKELKPLGLEWRADHVVSLVREAPAKYGSEIPRAKVALLSLTGVGDYVAGAATRRWSWRWQA
jgi:A/G-specific adenine glycosylase